MKIFIRILVVCIAMAACDSHASLISRDLVSVGDRLATYDDHTDKIWIKSSVTEGKSYAEVENLIASTYLYSGFHIASYEEVFGFADWYGFLDNQYDPEKVAQFYDVLIEPFVYDPTTTFFVTNRFGLSGTRESASIEERDHLGWSRAWGGSFGCENGDCRGTLSEMGAGDTALRGKDDRRAGRGYFLVRSAPEPGSLTLMLAGLAALALSRRFRSC